MKGRKRHPHEKRAQRRARRRAFFDIVERRRDLEAFLREMSWRTRHIEYAEFRKELTVLLVKSEAVPQKEDSK